MAVASLVLGIISLVVTIGSAGTLSFFGLICGLLGLIFGICGRKDEERRGMAIAGIVCSAIGLVLGIVLFIACVGVTYNVISNYNF